MARTRSVLAGALLASLALTGCTGGDDPKPTCTVDKVDVKTSKGGVGAFVTACAGKEDAKVSTAGWPLVDERGVWVAERTSGA